MRNSRATVIILGTALLASLSGCASDDLVGEIEIVGLGPSALRFDRELSVAAYAVREAEDSFFFSDVPLEDLLRHGPETPLRNGVFLHVQLIWTPKPGMTPVDPTATNAVTRVLIVSEGEVGLYGGAAFARADGESGEEELSLGVEGGTLTLLERTAGFNDLLSPAGFAGALRAPLAADETARWRRALSQFATNAFGKSLWVDARDGGAWSFMLAARPASHR
jgi:hypothetical protein